MPLIAAGCNKAVSQATTPPPPEVFFVEPQQRSYQESEEFTGRLWAIDTIEIRARVSGYLDKAFFKDGAIVKKGDTLFQIDPRTYETEVLRTTSAVTQLRARLQRLESQLARSKKLVTSNAVSKEEVEVLQFDRDEAEATMHAAEAAQRNAELNVEFATIKSPIDGKISRRLVDPGNLVQADMTALAHLVSLNPLYAYFDMDERTLLKIRRMDAATMSPVDVKLSLADRDDFSILGRVDFEDNQLDSSTGTLRMRAKVDNAGELLSPGMLRAVSLPDRRRKAGIVRAGRMPGFGSRTKLSLRHYEATRREQRRLERDGRQSRVSPRDCRRVDRRKTRDSK
ncbi:MAG: efflux RND transporter periplasmic adaptor subunit [Pirellulales bacterium]